MSAIRVIVFIPRAADKWLKLESLQIATSQFFINVNDNVALDYKTPTPREFGYAVFGKVIEGMTVVDTIKQKPTTTVQPYKNVPINDIKILKVILIKN